MIFYQLDYVVDEVLKTTPTREQILLKKYLNKNFQQIEAKFLWEKIADHKWYLGERLKRDVGFRTAAADYFENIYDSSSIFGIKPQRTKRERFLQTLSSALRSYFISKSKILQQ